MSEHIEWSRLPGIPQITKDFIEGKQKIASLLGGDWRDKDTLRRVQNTRGEFSRRKSLGSIIRKSYRDNIIPPSVSHSLDSLNQTDCLAIVTGQQPGLFGGPLYTFYKALSTVLFARELENRINVPVVPVFWMETADADFSEVNRIGFPPEDQYPRRATYTPRDIVAGRSTKWHQFTSDIVDVRQTVLEWLHPEPYKHLYTDALNRIYTPDSYLTDAFRNLLTTIFGDMGLVVIDPLEPEILAVCRDFWSECLQRPEGLNNAIAVSSKEIQSLRLPLQVRLRKDTLPVYRINQAGVRHRLSGSDNAWQVDTTGEVVNNEELLKYIDDEKGFFSPSVLLRPILQDWLLPTWIYVGGPSEIAYQAQTGRIYDQLNIPRPLIVPRIGATLVEKSVRRLLDKHNWSVTEVIGGAEILLRTAGKANELSELFNNGGTHLNGWLERIQQSADSAGLNISFELDQAGRKIEYQWQKLHKITVGKIIDRDKTRISHAKRLQNRLLPDEMLQERHNSALYFLSRYGEKLIQAIDSEKDLFQSHHLVIDLEQDR